MHNHMTRFCTIAPSHDSEKGMGINNIERKKQRNKNRNKILIVEDNRTVRLFLADMLASYGFLTNVAQDGVDAVDQFGKTVFPFVITDIDMPKMNGMQLLVYLKKYFPETKVIVMSGNCQNYGRDKIIKAGASAYLNKPFLSEEILDELKRMRVYPSSLNTDQQF